MPNWDNEIDEVAKQMTAGEPDAAFRARVLARIDTAESRRSRRWLMGWPRAAAAVAGIAIVAMAFYLRTPDVRLKPDTTQTSASNPPASADVRLKLDATPTSASNTSAPADVRPKPNESRTSPSGASAPVAFGLSRRAGTSPSGASASVASGFSQTERANDEPYAMASLAPSPIAIEPLSLDAMESMDAIELNRLTVAPLLVDPIGQ